MATTQKRGGLREAQAQGQVRDGQQLEKFAAKGLGEFQEGRPLLLVATSR